MIRSLALQWAARFRHNQNLMRLSSSYASPATLHHATPSSSSAEPVHITPNCVRVCPLFIFFIIFSSIYVSFYARRNPARISVNWWSLLNTIKIWFYFSFDIAIGFVPIWQSENWGFNNHWCFFVSRYSIGERTDKYALFSHSSMIGARRWNI